MFCFRMFRFYQNSPSPFLGLVRHYYSMNTCTVCRQNQQLLLSTARKYQVTEETLVYLLVLCYFKEAVVIRSL